ncbi:hypothetical protein [Pedobacter aquatilis]|uniref:hypothetical protein n=1 Tax=Pedobacter aquatilis TaxID=351343 RepID=UPI00292CB808|nr:hypothetical protein [Pedobacter aquatilis]
MENKELTPPQAFEVIYQLTGGLQLNRADSDVLNRALGTLAQLVQATTKQENINDNI